jgi:hypothetical protein
MIGIRLAHLAFGKIEMRLVQWERLGKVVVVERGQNSPVGLREEEVSL